MVGLPLLALINAQGASPKVLAYRRGDAVVSASTDSVPAPYWLGFDVEDTTLDQGSPKDSGGGFYVLSGGKNRTILVRFGGISQLIGANVKVLDAKLVLTKASHGAPVLTGCSAVGQAWGEGPSLTISGQLAKLGTASSVPISTPSLARAGWGAANWQTARSGVKGADWAQPGAGGFPAVRVSGKDEADGTYEIDGLGPQVQTWLNHPWTNHGLALQFSTDSMFDSSEAPGLGPMLVVRYEELPAQAKAEARQAADLVVESLVKGDDGWTATVVNTGSKPSTPTQLNVSVDGAPSDPLAIGPVAAGASVKLAFAAGPSAKDDARVGSVTASVAGDSADDRWGSASNAGGGFPVAFSLSASDPLASAKAMWLVSEVNAALDRSRFSFAPAGCMERIAWVPQGTPGSAEVKLDPEVFESAANGDQASLATAWRAILAAAGATDFRSESIEGGPIAGGDGTAAASKEFFGGATILENGLLGGSRTYDGGLPTALTIPTQAYRVGYMKTAATKPFGPLGAATIGELNQLAGKQGDARAKTIDGFAADFPRVVLMRVMDQLGSPLKSLDLSFYRLVDGKAGPQPEFSLNSDGTGSCILNNVPVASGSSVQNPFGTRLLGSNGAFLVQAKQGTTSAWSFLSAATLMEEYYRGSQSAGFADLRFALPQAPIQTGTDFAKDADVTSSGSTGEPSAPWSVQAAGTGDGWLQLDLHRDRVLGQIEIVFDGIPTCSRFKVLVYNTGQSAKDAAVWADEPDLAWTIANRGRPLGNGRYAVSWFGPIFPGRFIRIVPEGKGFLKIAGFSVFSPLPQRN